MFLSTAQWGTSNPPGVTQLYTANLDGTGFLELTSGSEPTGVQQYTMSDDGQMAWYISGDGKLVKLDLSTGQPVRTVFRPAAVDLSGTLVPGSAATLGGAGLSRHRVWSLAGIPADHAARQSQGLPERHSRATAIRRAWRHHGSSAVGDSGGTTGHIAGSDECRYAGRVIRAGCGHAGGPLAFADSGPRMPYRCGLNGGAIHHDWSSYVTPDRPASPGEVLHLYGTGFGPVQPAVATGTPAPASPLAVVPAMPTCTSDPGGPTTVAYLGLAPGLVGYYQMDVQLPAAISTVHPTENTTYDQFYIACGRGVSAVFAIKTTVP